MIDDRTAKRPFILTFAATVFALNIVHLEIARATDCPDYHLANALPRDEPLYYAFDSSVYSYAHHESRRVDEHGNAFRYRTFIFDSPEAHVGRFAFDVSSRPRTEPPSSGRRDLQPEGLALGPKEHSLRWSPSQAGANLAGCFSRVLVIVAIVAGSAVRALAAAVTAVVVVAIIDGVVTAAVRGARAVFALEPGLAIGAGDAGLAFDGTGHRCARATDVRCTAGGQNGHAGHEEDS
jgi:hypothetical protein